MLKKAQEAVDMRSEHVGHFLALSDSLPATTVATFTALVQAWEADPSKDNPYQATIEGKVAGSHDIPPLLIYHRFYLAFIPPLLIYHFYLFISFASHVMLST